MTWNVLYKEKADNILALTMEIKPDILCCQEITKDSFINPSRDVPKEISNILGGDYRYHQVLDSLEDQPGNMGNAIFSKYPITRQRHLLLQRGSADIDSSSQNRGYLEIRTKIDNVIFTVGTTHLSYVDGFVETDARNKEADKLVNFLKDKQEKFVICGDFNSAPGSKTINRLEQLLVSTGPPHQLKTFATKPFVHNDFVVEGLEWRLDYIFTTRDVKVLSSKIINTEFSDHLPIVVELEF